MVNDVCILRRTAAYVIDMTTRQKCYQDSGSNYSSDAISASSDRKAQPALCVELVGSRFLRRMVRLIVVTSLRTPSSLLFPLYALFSSPFTLQLWFEQATAVRESVLAESLRNENILLDIAISGKRLFKH